MNLLLHKNGRVCKLLTLLPLAVSPYVIMPARVGLNTTDFVEVRWRMRRKANRQSGVGPMTLFKICIAVWFGLAAIGAAMALADGALAFVGVLARG